MALEVDYLPVATGAGANVASQADFAGSGWQEDGFTAGIAEPDEANKIWRQSSMVAACVANFISQVLNINVLDDGDIATLIANFLAAVQAVATGTGAPRVIAVAGSATPALDCGAGNPLFVVFEVQLTQNAAPIIFGAVAGQLVNITWVQNAPGGYTVTAPGNLIGLGDPSTIPSGSQGSQLFRVGSDNNLHAAGPLLIG